MEILAGAQVGRARVFDALHELGRALAGARSLEGALAFCGHLRQESWKVNGRLGTVVRQAVGHGKKVVRWGLSLDMSLLQSQPSRLWYGKVEKEETCKPRHAVGN